MVILLFPPRPRRRKVKTKKLVISLLIVLILGLSGVSYADDLKVFEVAVAIQDSEDKIATLDWNQVIARRGCCSWHGGVCDCIGGRVVCCDGTFSPSCTCNRDSDKEVMDFQN